MFKIKPKIPFVVVMTFSRPSLAYVAQLYLQDKLLLAKMFRLYKYKYQTKDFMYLHFHNDGNKVFKVFFQVVMKNKTKLTNQLFWNCKALFDCFDMVIETKKDFDFDSHIQPANTQQLVTDFNPNPTAPPYQGGVNQWPKNNNYNPNQPPQFKPINNPKTIPNTSYGNRGGIMPNPNQPMNKPTATLANQPTYNQPNPNGYNEWNKFVAPNGLDQTQLNNQTNPNLVKNQNVDAINQTWKPNPTTNYPSPVTNYEFDYEPKPSYVPKKSN